MSLAVWARSYDPTLKQAIAQVHALPPWKEGRVLHPFAYDPEKGYDEDFGNREIKQMIEGAPIRDVPLEGLVGIQHSVMPERVEEYIKHPGIIPTGERDPKHRGLVDHPIVVLYKGRRFIHDGHHRCTAALLSGDKTVPARVVDLSRIVKS